MIAGALSKNGKIGYVADYPIVGMTANINAFALGARMVNPYAKVYLEWTTVKEIRGRMYFVNSRKMESNTFPIRL